MSSKREKRKHAKRLREFGTDHEERKRKHQASKIRRAERRREGGSVRRRDWRGAGAGAGDDEDGAATAARVEPMRRGGASRDELARRLAAADAAPPRPAAVDSGTQALRGSGALSGDGALSGGGEGDATGDGALGDGAIGDGAFDKGALDDLDDGALGHGAVGVEAVGAGRRTVSGLVVGLDRTLARVRIDGVVEACRLAPALFAGGHVDVAVGDRARVRLEGAARTLVGVEPRRTRLARPDPGDPRVERVVAANVDVVVVVAAARTPPLKPGLVDRYLVAIERGGAAPLVCLNKLDLVPARERAETLERLAPYRAIGVPVVVASAATGEGVAELRARLAGSLCAFVGHSGVGKSSLVNALAGAPAQATGAVSSAHGKGRHTTTAARLVELEGDVAIVDTPGIRAFGLDLDARELAAYFPELAAAGPCRYGDCSHVHEPSCAVRAAVEAGRLSAARYESYVRIRDSLGE